MNRKKKLNDAYNKRLKKKNDKLRIINKPKYISKADREKMASTDDQIQVREDQFESGEVDI